MNKYAKRAMQLQKEGFNCSQCVVASMCEEFNVDYITALKFAGAFGSGIGGTGETCGAITGALMLIGLKYGKTTAYDSGESKCFEISEKFIAQFQQKHDGKLKCKELLGFDIQTEYGLAQIHENNLFEKRCRIFIKDGINIISELLNDNK